MHNPITRILLPLALSAAVCSFGRVSLAQNTNAETEQDSALATQAALKSVLSNTEVPLSLKMRKMDSSWRRFIANTGAMNSQAEIWGATTGLEFGVHYTQGRTVVMGKDTFLVAYHLPVRIDRRFLNWHGHGEAPRPRKPDTETVLNLSLLNLTNMNALKDLRPFNAETDIESVAQINTASVRTLTTLGNGMMRFIRARGTFPQLSNPINWDAKRAFYPYVGDERLFMHLSTQRMYLWNQNLNGKKAANFKSKQSTVLFYEAENGGDDTRGVLFMDGHVERLNAAHWARVRKASKIWEDGDPTEAAAGGGRRIQRTFNAAGNTLTD